MEDTAFILVCDSPYHLILPSVRLNPSETPERRRASSCGAIKFSGASKQLVDRGEATALNRVLEIPRLPGIPCGISFSTGECALLANLVNHSGSFSEYTF